MKCPLALSLRVTPIPSRTTQKSTRPRASDRPMCCQPGTRHGLAASEIDRRRHYSIKMHEMEARNTTQHVVSHTGAERQGNIFSFQSREKNVLDLSSYRPRRFHQLRIATTPRNAAPPLNPRIAIVSQGPHGGVAFCPRGVYTRQCLWHSL